MCESAAASLMCARRFRWLDLLCMFSCHFVLMCNKCSQKFAGVQKGDLRIRCTFTEYRQFFQRGSFCVHD